MVTSPNWIAPRHMDRAIGPSCSCFCAHFAAVPCDVQRARAVMLQRARKHPPYPIGTTPMGHRPTRESAQNFTAMNEPNAALRAYVLEDDADIAALEADLLREMG